MGDLVRQSACGDAFAVVIDQRIQLAEILGVKPPQ